MLKVTNLWMTSHVWDSETFRNVHPQVVGPGQGRHKLKIHKYGSVLQDSCGSGAGAGSSQTENTQIRFSFIGFFTGKLHSQIVGPGQGCYKLNTTFTVQFYRIHYWETAFPDNGPGSGLSQTEHTQIQFIFTGFTTSSQPGLGLGCHKLNTHKYSSFLQDSPQVHSLVWGWVVTNW
jgi:hypothetical protein